MSQVPDFNKPEYLERFNRDGYVVVPCFLNTEQVQYLQTLFDTTRDKAAVNEQFYTSHWSKNAEYRNQNGARQARKTFLARFCVTA